MNTQAQVSSNDPTIAANIARWHDEARRRKLGKERFEFRSKFNPVIVPELNIRVSQKTLARIQNSH